MRIAALPADTQPDADARRVRPPLSQPTANGRPATTTTGGTVEWQPGTCRHAFGLSIGMDLAMRWSTATGPGSLQYLAGTPALNRLTRAVDETAARLGGEHRATSRAPVELAHTYLLTDRFDQGIALQEQTIEDWSQVDSADHPDVLQERADLVLAYRMADRPDTPLTVMRHVAADTAARFGPDHPRTRGAEQVLQQWTDTPLSYPARKRTTRD